MYVYAFEEDCLWPFHPVSRAGGAPDLHPYSDSIKSLGFRVFLVSSFEL